MLDVLWGFGRGGGSDCWGSLSCNLPVFSLENGLFYMFYSLLKHTISTHFRQFEMQKRSEPHLNCFDDLFGEKETASYFRNYFQWIFCHGSSVLLGVLAGKSESWIVFPDFFLASFSFFAHVSHFRWGRRFLWRGKSISGFLFGFFADDSSVPVISLAGKTRLSLPDFFWTLFKRSTIQRISNFFWYFS